MQLLTLPHSPALATSIRATASVFEDAKSQTLLAHLQKVAPSEASVLIIGETGTGKELVARHVHNLSNRVDPLHKDVACRQFHPPQGDAHSRKYTNLLWRAIEAFSEETLNTILKIP